MDTTIRRDRVGLSRRIVVRGGACVTVVARGLGLLRRDVGGFVAVGREVATEFDEEVSSENHGDALEQGGVDRVFLEQSVDVGAVATEFAGEP